MAEGERERGGWAGAGMRARTSQPALQAADDGRADNTAGMLTCQKRLLLEEEEKTKLSSKCHQVNLNRNRIPAETRVTYGQPVHFLQPAAFI